MSDLLAPRFTYVPAEPATVIAARAWLAANIYGWTGAGADASGGEVIAAIDANYNGEWTEFVADHG